MSAIENLKLLCVYGIDLSLYEKMRPWLDEEVGRRIVFISEEGDKGAQFDDVRVKVYFLDSPLQVEPVAKKVAWDAVFQELSFTIASEGRYTSAFKNELERCQIASNLVLSEAADYGTVATQNAWKNRKNRIRCGLGLKNRFNNVPAVIVGAGPSLEKNGHLIKEFPGLVFAGGTALKLLDTKPHFAASIDKEAPPIPSVRAPFCFQSRMNPENFSRVEGPLLQFPDGSAPWINWINGQEGSLDMGWTVGNFLTAIALFLGCNPIVFVGMDLCYADGKKYARLKEEAAPGLIEVGGKLTQRDWVMAAKWTEELAQKHSDVKFINATEGGLELEAPILARKFSKLLPGEKEDYHSRVEAEIAKLTPLAANRWKEWKQSLKTGEGVSRELLLDPLWSIWKPVFERELLFDPHPDKLALNQNLFFQQVIQEHLHAL